MGNGCSLTFNSSRGRSLGDQCDAFECVCGKHTANHLVCVCFCLFASLLIKAAGARGFSILPSMLDITRALADPMSCGCGRLCCSFESSHDQTENVLTLAKGIHSKLCGSQASALSLSHSARKLWLVCLTHGCMACTRDHIGLHVRA